MTRKQGSILPILGLEVDKPNEYIDNRTTPSCKNVDIEKSVIRKRCGTSVIGTTQSERIMNGREIEVDGVKFNVRIGLSAIKLLNAVTLDWDTITGTALTGTEIDTVCTAVPQLLGKPILAFTNGKDVIRKYTGTGNVAVLGGSPPIAKYILDYKGYLILAYITTGGSVYPHRVQWSNTGSPEVWTGGNSGSVDLMEDGDKITGLARLGQQITLHKENCIYVGYLTAASTVFSFDRKNTGAGAVHQNAIQELPTGDQIFLAKDGLRLFNGISASLIPSSISTELRYSINFEYVYKTWSVIVRDRDEVWFGIAMGSQTDPDTVYKYNYLTGQVYKDYRPGITAAWLYLVASVTPWNSLVGTWDDQTWSWDSSLFQKGVQSIMLSDSAGLSYKRDIGVNNDNLVAFRSEWESKDYTSEETGKILRWQQAEVWAKGTTIYCEYSIDGGLTWTFIKNGILDSEYPADDSPLMLYFDVVSSKIKFRFSNEAAGGTFYLKQFIIQYQEREFRS